MVFENVREGFVGRAAFGFPNLKVVCLNPVGRLTVKLSCANIAKSVFKNFIREYIVVNPVKPGEI